MGYSAFAVRAVTGLMAAVQGMTKRTLLMALLSAAAGFGGAVWGTRRPPLVLRDVHEVDGVATRGGWIDLEFTLTRDRPCEARVERWLWTEEEDGTRRWVQIPATQNPPTMLGREVRYKLSLPVPGNIDPGHWHYWSRTYDGCSWIPSFFGSDPPRDSADIPVDIVDPKQSKPAIVVAPPGPVTILPTEPKQ